MTTQSKKSEAERLIETLQPCWRGSRDDNKAFRSTESSKEAESTEITGLPQAKPSQRQ